MRKQIEGRKDRSEAVRALRPRKIKALPETVITGNGIGDRIDWAWSKIECGGKGIGNANKDSQVFSLSDRA